MAWAEAAAAKEARISFWLFTRDTLLRLLTEAPIPVNVMTNIEKE